MLDLPALDGRTPLGFLAALGVLRLVTEHTDYSPRLAWSRSTGTAELHDAHDSVDDLVDDLAAVVAAIPADGVLPGLDHAFPPLKGAPARMRLKRPDLRAYALAATKCDGEAIERWIASLVTDLSVDKDGCSTISLFAAPSGQQSMRTMLEKPLDMVRARPALLREALVAWRRYTGVSGEYLDHRVLHDAADAADGKSAERGVPGATWLALMSYPMMRTTSLGNGPTTSGWQDLGHRRGRRLIWPIWSTALDVDAVQALLDHPVLDDAAPGRPANPAAALSIFWIAHAARRTIPGRTFAGVLAPVADPASRLPR